MNNPMPWKKPIIREIRNGIQKFCENCKKATTHRYMKDTNIRVCEKCYTGGSELEGE